MMMKRYRFLTVCILFLVCLCTAACGAAAPQPDPVEMTPYPENSVAPRAENSYSTSSYSTTGTEQTVDEIVAALEPHKPEDLGVANLGEYKGLHLSFEEQFVTDADVQAYLDEYVLPAYKSLKGITDTDAGDILLDDSAIRELDPSFSSLAEFKDYIRQKLNEETEYTNRTRLYYTAIDAVIRNSAPEPTEEAVEWQIDYFLKMFYDEVRSNYDGMTMDDLVTLYGTTYQGFRDSLREYAEESVNQMLIMDAIADREGIEVSEKDIEEYADAHGLTPDLLKQSTTEEDLLASVRRELAARFVVDHAVIS